MSSPENIKFIPIRLNTLRGNRDLTFDLFIKIGDRHVHYVKEKDSVEEERLSRLNKKGLRKVFIKDSDEQSYLSYLDACLDDLGDTKISSSEKAVQVRDTLTTQAENAERNLETEQAYERMRSQLDKINGFFKNDPDALKNLISATVLATDTTQHCSNVASLALGIATKVGIKEAQDLTDLGVAALVHDIGAVKFGLDPLVTRESLKGTPQLKKYLSHPAESVGFLSGKPFITPRVLALVADHEEFGEGRGYPEKKQIAKLHPTAQILNLANAFDKFCMVQKMEPKAAIDPFFERYGDFFVSEHLNILATVVSAAK